MKNPKLSFILIALLATSLFNCDGDDPEPVNEEELITTVRLTFTNERNSNDVVVASFTDLDGPGGDAPIIVNPILGDNARYELTIEFLNESESPAEDITEEVRAEDEEHQVFYVASSSLDFGYLYEDSDSNGGLVGLEGLVVTGSASAGVLEVTLVHEPDKNTIASIAGNPAGVGGEIDIEVSFNVTIQ